MKLNRIILPILLIIALSFFVESISIVFQDADTENIDDVTKSYVNTNFNFSDRNKGFVRAHAESNKTVFYDAEDSKINTTILVYRDYQYVIDGSVNTTSIQINIEDCLSATNLTAKVWNGTSLAPDTVIFIGQNVSCVAGENVITLGHQASTNAVYEWIGFESDSNVTISQDSTGENQDYYGHNGVDWVNLENTDYKFSFYIVRGEQEFYIKFNSSALPTGLTVSEASLSVHGESQGGIWINISIYQVFSFDWYEETLITNQIPTRNDTPLDTIEWATLNPAWFEYNVTYGLNLSSDIQAFVLNVTANSVAGWSRYAEEIKTKEHSTSSLRPYLTITYTENIPPTYSSFTNNATSTSYDGIAKWTAVMADNDALDFVMFADNQTGTLMNMTSTDISGSSKTLGRSSTINLTRGNYICGQAWFNDTSGNINQTNMSCFTVANAAPTFNETINNYQLNHNQNLSVDVNCSDNDFDSLIYLDNTSLFNINGSTGIIFDNPDETEAGDYSVNISCSDTIVNSSNVIWYNVTSAIPTVNASLTPSPAENADDLTCDISFADLDGDLIADNMTRWYFNGTENTTLRNLTTIGNTNTSIGDQWICSARVHDGYDWSVWDNSSMLVIGDSITPNLNSISFSATSFLSSVVMNTTVNCTDASSNMDWAKFELTVGGVTTNKTMTQGGDIWHFAQTYGVGTYTVDNFYCSDSSGNENITYSGQTLTVTSGAVANEGGGGGGGLPIGISECGLELFRPKAGGQIQMFAPVGKETQQTEFTIRNNGNKTGTYDFTIKNNKFLSENCILGQESATIPADLTFTNVIICLVPAQQTTAQIEISGCGVTSNYKLVVSSNRILEIFSSVFSGNNVKIFGIDLSPLEFVIVFFIVAAVIFLIVTILIQLLVSLKR